MIRLRTDGQMTDKGFRRFKPKEPSRRDLRRLAQTKVKEFDTDMARCRENKKYKEEPICPPESV